MSTITRNKDQHFIQGVYPHGAQRLNTNHVGNASNLSGGNLTQVLNNLNIGGDLPAPDGTAAAPSIAFANDLDTGIFRPGDNRIGFSVGGLHVATIDANAQGLIVDGTVVADFLNLGDGSPGVASTSAFFDSNPTTGINHAVGQGNAFDLVANTVPIVNVNTTGINVTGKTQTSTLALGSGVIGPGTMSASFISDPDTGINHTTGGIFSLVSNGTTEMAVTPGEVIVNTRLIVGTEIVLNTDIADKNILQSNASGVFRSTSIPTALQSGANAASLAIGTGSTAGVGSLTIGDGATSTHTNSVVLGRGATSTANGELVVRLGNSNTTQLRTTLTTDATLRPTLVTYLPVQLNNTTFYIQLWQ